MNYVYSVQVWLAFSSRQEEDQEMADIVESLENLSQPQEVRWDKHVWHLLDLWWKHTVMLAGFGVAAAVLVAAVDFVLMKTF